MMVKRDHGNRYNPFDHLYDIYPIIVKKLDGYTYELSEIEKALKAKESMSLCQADLNDLLDLERRIDNLPKPSDFEVRDRVEIRSPSLKDLGL
jgi:hypothetical protein